MEQWPKEKLIAEVIKLEEKLTFYETKLRDLVTAYRSLVKQKEALELSITALQNVQQVDKPNSDSQTDVNKVSSNEFSPKSDSLREQTEINFNNEVTTLMNSIATLSAEKCRMEASFQADKKQLRQDKEKNELLIKELQEKLKRLIYDSSKEIEQLKSKLIIEKHEREKEQNDHVVIMSELQILLSKEKEEKIILEKKLSELTPKLQLLVNKEEVERYKENDLTQKFVSLQKKHLTVLEEERKRIQQTEQESKKQITIHEQRVANLETRLTELSLTVANYHRLRQEDQNEITKLKAHIAEVDSQTKANDSQEERDFDIIKNGSEAELTAYVKSLVDKMMKYKSLLMNANQYLDKTIEVNSILCDNCSSYEVHSVNLEVHRKLLNEYESLMQQFKESSKTVDEIENLKVKVQVLQDRNSVLMNQIEETIKKYEYDLKNSQEQINTLNAKHSKEIDSLHSIYKTQIIELENQLQKQRDRTLALLDEKEQEVSTLKSSFQIFLPGNRHHLENKGTNKIFKHSQLSGVLDGNLDISMGESPHILHYAHEIARRDVDIANLRKVSNQQELKLHELNKEVVLQKEKHREEVERLNEIIARLERCQSREGANLEYLKNVIVNYFLTQSSSSKRHMFNAIATVLKFSDSEIQSIKNNF